LNSLAKTTKKPQNKNARCSGRTKILTKVQILDFDAGTEGEPLDERVEKPYF
jgi:hypothetical protein